MSTFKEYSSHTHFVFSLLLSFVSTGILYYRYLLSCFQTCSVEVWGPKRYYSSKDEDETSYEYMHEDRLYLRLLDYLCHPTNNFYPKSVSAAPSPQIVQYHVCADNHFEHKEDMKAPTNLAKYPIRLGPQYSHPHQIKYKGEFLTVERTEAPQVSRYGYPYEKIKISTERRNHALIYELLTNALNSKNGDNGDPRKVQIFKPTNDGCSCCLSSCWEEIGKPRAGRPLESIILAEGVKEKLVADFTEYLASREWYEEREIPYTRGYLLYGPPGSGKSSLIKALATEFNRSICLLSLTAKGMTDYSLSRYMNTAPKNSLILLEDIDAAFKSREDEFADASEQNLTLGGASSSSVTFSGLLNALDGVLVGGSDGRVVVLTTNYVDRLDSALIRPGRVDFKMCLDYPTDSQIKRLFQRIYENTVVADKIGDDDAEEFVTCVRSCSGDVKVTMAMVQGLLMTIQARNKQRPCQPYEWYQEARSYFKEQICPHKNNKQGLWGLYV